MAILRRNGMGGTGNIWPGFVDAMTALLIVLMFVLTIFMIVQFVLRETITGQDAELNTLSAKIATLADALGVEEQRSSGLRGELALLAQDLEATKSKITQQSALITSFEAQVANLISDKENLAAELASAQSILATARDEIDLKTEQARLAAAKREALEALVADLNTQAADQEQKLSIAETALSEQEQQRALEAAAAKALQDRLKGAQDELTAMTLVLEAKRKEAEDTLTLLAAAELAQKNAEKLSSQALSEKQKEAALLAQANALLGQEKAASAESQRKLALLNQQTSALRAQLNNLQHLLDVAKAQDEQAKIQIETLGSNLNAALARVASEQKQKAELEEKERKRLAAEAKDLKKFKSEFFGRMRDVLGSKEGVRIVGDRFVFSSEILFPAGSATLGSRGKQEISKVANIILDVAGKIPPEIDWVLRVDGHTDKLPLSGVGEYADNWELSQARALSVVKYMIADLGIPPNRLSANGFGEFQPIVDDVTPKALALNRRIELKFTEK